MEALEQEARRLSRRFLTEDAQYRMGFVEAEQRNPHTERLGETFAEDTRAGMRMLLSADEALVPVFTELLGGAEYRAFARAVGETLSGGGRVILSGCGSTGRLAMRLEASWRQAVRAMGLSRLEHSVLALMTGGDYAIIRSVESFEDYTQLGAMQAQALSLTDRDLLVGITATGETTSILGTAGQALSDGARVWMVVCTRPQSLLGRLERADAVYTHPRCRSLYIPCGGMAVTGSTRMQSSTLEQAVIGCALEQALDPAAEAGRLGEGYARMIGALGRDDVQGALCAQTEAEQALYERGGYLTYFAREYLLDILADTTERSPTFSVPGFRPQGRRDMPLSWAFVKNPELPTEAAWRTALEREPRCLDKTPAEYAALGIRGEDVARIPAIDRQALLAYQIGCEPDPEREEADSLAVWVDLRNPPPESFRAQEGRYRSARVFTPCVPESALMGTRMRLFHHLAMKLALNDVSTGTMARMGRIRGNYMIDVRISNKKLVDRATRILSTLAAIPYEEANGLLYLCELINRQKGAQEPVIRMALDLLDKKEP